MKKQELVIRRILYSAAIFFSVLFTCLRAYMLLTGYDAASGFYTSVVLHNLLRGGLIVFTVLVFAAGHIYIKEGNSDDLRFQNRLSKIGTCILSAALSGFVLYTLAKWLFFKTADTADLAACPFAFFAALYQWTNLREHKQAGNYRGPLTLCSALVCLVIVFGLYFNPRLSYINHTVVLAFAAFVFLMLTITAEANFEIQRSACRRLFSYAPVAIVLAFTLSVPNLLYRILRGSAPLSDVFYDILLLAFGLYYAAKLTAALTARSEGTEA